MPSIVTRSEIGNWSGRGVGLIIGPQVTFQGTSTFADLNKHLALRFAVTEGPDYLTTVDSALDAGAMRSSVEQCITEWLKTRQLGRVYETLVRGQWEAVVSLDYTNHFEEKLRSQNSRRPLGRTISIVRSNDPFFPPRTIPVFKVLGEIGKQFICAQSELEEYLIDIDEVVRSFVDCARNSIFCVGVDPYWMIIERIAIAMRKSRSSCPKDIFFVGSPAPPNLSRLERLLSGRAKIHIVSATPGEVARELSRPSLSQQRLLQFAESDDPYHRLAQYADIAEIVNRHTSSSVDISQTNFLLDLLFSPGKPNWDPFVHDLDLPRSATKRLYDSITEISEPKKGPNIAFILKGAVATGKTTLLKRLALDLGKSNKIVLWIKSYDYADKSDRFKSLFTAAAKVDRTSPIVVFLDDPNDLHTSPREIFDFASAAGLRIIQIIGIRTLDYDLVSNEELLGGTASVSAITSLAEDFDKSEWNALPEYLVKIGVSSDLDSAQVKVRTAASKNSRDVLATLYYLLPGSISSITSAIKSEYFRLGDSEVLSQSIRRRLGQISGILRSAYEYIAVAEWFRSPLPVEVLVSALGVDYGQWADITRETTESLGLFYADDDMDANDGGHFYRTRNWIVRDAVLDIINAGRHTMFASVGKMKELLDACDSSQLVYRQFIIRTLVPFKKLVDLDLDLSSGLSLYRSAQDALPFPDRTLEHHEGLWLREKGSLNEALQVLESALSAPQYPGAPQIEHDEHIHTSAASVILKMIERSEISVEKGKEECQRHYKKAGSDVYLNPHAVHTYARLMIALSDRDAAQNPGDSSLFLNQALSDIDKTLLTMQSSSDDVKFAGDDSISMLEDERRRIYVRFPVDQLKDNASHLWKTAGSQIGFSVALKALHNTAESKDNATLYNEAWVYFKKCERKVEELQPVLAESAMFLYYKWQVFRRYSLDPAATTTPPDWTVLLSLSNRAAQGGRQNIWDQYIHALALAHLGRWGESNAVFSEIRGSKGYNRTMWAARDYLLTTHGDLARVHGIVVKGQNSFLRVPDLNTDFLVAKREQWRTGSSVTAYIEFTFMGPRAVSSIESNLKRLKTSLR